MLFFLKDDDFENFVPTKSKRTKVVDQETAKNEVVAAKKSSNSRKYEQKRADLRVQEMLQLHVFTEKGSNAFHCKIVCLKKICKRR